MLEGFLHDQVVGRRVRVDADDVGLQLGETGGVVGVEIPAPEALPDGLEDTLVEIDGTGQLESVHLGQALDEAAATHAATHHHASQ